jgi:hypothetical protein
MQRLRLPSFESNQLINLRNYLVINILIIL